MTPGPSHDPPPVIRLACPHSSSRHLDDGPPPHRFIRIADLIRPPPHIFHKHIIADQQQPGLTARTASACCSRHPFPTQANLRLGTLEAGASDQPAQRWARGPRGLAEIA